MIATVSIPTTDYTSILEQQIGEATTPIECLVVAHNNPVLVNRLEDAFGDERTLLLEVAQGQWDLEGGELKDAISWAVQNGGIKYLIVVGDSSASLRNHRQPVTDMRNPIELALAASTCREAALEAFQHEVNQLCQADEVSKLLSAGDLEITALFYREEAGVFSLYDEKTNSLQLLSSSS